GAVLCDARRDSVDAALTSLQALMERQAQLRADYLSLLGDLPEELPLNAVVTDTVEGGDGYYIEKLHFQSRPDFHVTANFYIPDTGDGPYPAVLIMIGHYPIGKGIGLMQQLSALFATHGIAALLVDPFGQGERYQVQDPQSGELELVGGSGTTGHTLLDVGAMLDGRSVVAHAVWDNHRALDYLYARMDVVDTARIGATGSSGGGSQCTYLSAYDPRIKVSAVNSFLMNEETLYATIGPQTGSQNLSYEGAHLIDHPDYITMFAPKPFLILAATNDFFDINGTHETYEEAMQVYDVFGMPDHLRYFEEDGEHGYAQPRREEAVRWFRKWFYDDDSPVMEPTDFDILGGAVTQVTGTGQVVTEFPTEQTVTDLNIDIADDLADDRADFWANNTADSCLNKVRELIRYEPYGPVVVEPGDVFDRGNYTVTKLKIDADDHVPVPGLLFVPDGLSGPTPAVLYVDGCGKKDDAVENGVIEQLLVDSGKIVLTIDVRGFGETADNPGKNESKHWNKEHRNAVIAGYIGKTLIGQRVEDIQKGLDVLLEVPNVDAGDLTLIGVDRAGTAALHTAALDDRVTKTILLGSFESWLPIVASPTERDNLTHVVPFALKYYDLPDLVNTLPTNSVMYMEEPYSVVNAIEEVEGAQSDRLDQNFPNPASAKTTIPYKLDRAAQVQLRIFDREGKLCRVIDQGRQSSGRYQLTVETAGL
ncbi:MAG: acetylxylan esterase, partial [Phaeodactylibacter sp.]|nr:acetylxylan esterase [Phaeodactylibacter sp.]